MVNAPRDDDDDDHEDDDDQARPRGGVRPWGGRTLAGDLCRQLKGLRSSGKMLSEF